jgi:hypothetical protein
MVKSNKTKRIGMSIYYVRLQEQLLNKFYSVNQQGTKTVEDLDVIVKMTLKRNTVTAYPEDDGCIN